MRATGIVRRIDDLGRVVVPKEIRRTLRIREGDPLEIFTDREGEIILKKYSPIGEQSIGTIISEGDAIGSVVLDNRDEKCKMGETESKLVSVAAGFLGRQMEQ